MVAETIRTIKAELRAAMNGIASRAIRESGMDYKLVYGVELPRLRQLAAEVQQEHLTHSADFMRRLATALWQEPIRECKMLAIMLFPIDEFDRERADLWAESLSCEQAELAQLLSMDILCRAPYAVDVAFEWMAAEGQMFQLCGFLTFTRLLMQGAELSPAAEEEFLDQAVSALHNTYLPLCKAVQNALLRYAENVPAAAETIQRFLCN